MTLVLIRGFLSYLDRNGELAIGQAPANVRAWLDKIDIPQRLRRLLHDYWPTQEGEGDSLHRGYELRTAESIMGGKDTDALLADGMLPLGNAGNGDFIVVRLETGDDLEVGFVSHDEFWEERTTPKDCYAKLADSIDEFLMRVVDQLYLPFEYYEAVRYNELRDRLAASDPFRPNEPMR